MFSSDVHKSWHGKTAKKKHSVDDWAYGTEPIPKDRSWAQKKPLEGAEGNKEDEREETIAPLP